jgi:hypothetical protein
MTFLFIYYITICLLALIFAIYTLFGTSSPNISECNRIKKRSVNNYSHGDETVSYDRVEKIIPCDMVSGCKDLNRVCLHISEPLQLENGIVLERNASAKDGYCFMYEKSTEEMHCDPRFGERLTAVTRSGQLRTSCNCFWPSLVDRKDTVSDCSLTRACGGTGKLVHKITNTPIEHMPPDTPIDIYEFECETCGSDDCAKPGRDPDTGLPSCEPIPVVQRSGGLCLYEHLLVTNDDVAVDGIVAGQVSKKRKSTSAPTLAVKSDFVDTAFANSFVSTSNSDNVYVPNPCAFDAFRGVPMKAGECRLTLTPGGVGYCEPLSETVSTVIFDDDYLSKNGGRYSNACYKFTDSDANINAYVAEYFVRPRNALHPSNPPDTRPPPPPPPLPVFSVEIEAGKLFPEVLDMLNARSTVDHQKKILITQSAIPNDVESIPVPFDKTTMSRFTKEHNDFVFYLPAKIAFYNYWAPVQSVDILNCDDINSERKIYGFTLNSLEASEYVVERQRKVVACREPYYDRRLAIVPNIDVNPLGTAYNANPTSAILRFNKSDLTVRPYWYESYFNNRHEVKAYVSRLPSRPPIISPTK